MSKEIKIVIAEDNSVLNLLLKLSLKKEGYTLFFATDGKEAKTLIEKHDPNVILTDIMMDYLSVGIDPKKSVIFLESEVPAIYELTFLLSMLIPYSRVMRNPTIKDEIRDKNLGENYSFGFMSYVIAQAADILCFRPDLVPVGEDQLPHLEMNNLYYLQLLIFL